MHGTMKFSPPWHVAHAAIVECCSDMDSRLPWYSRAWHSGIPTVTD